jgi:NTE family protein
VSGIGLVLGAGGVVGQAFHAGVLAALEHDVGWDARDVDIVVGTSAGSITGTLLRTGVPATELAAWTVKAPLTDEGTVLEEMFGTEPPEFAPFRPLHVLRRPPKLPGPAMVRRALVRPWHFRPVAAALSLLGPGRHDIAEQLDALSEIEGQAWPEKDLWICAVRRRDGRRVVFGRPGSPDAPLHLAIAASCAVPGHFAPVQIGDRAYVDGGAHSPTNAAVLRDRALDLVIVVSPMSGPPGRRTSVYDMSRRHATRLVRREVAALRAAGTAVVVFRPDPDTQAVMGDDFMAGARVEEIVQHAFLAAGTHAARPEVRTQLDLLCAREPTSD